MITKAYILSVNPQLNKYQIRIPIFEKPGLSSEDSIFSSAIFSATLSHEPTARQSYKVGDVVFVGFENNDLNKPVIIGKLYTVGEEPTPVGAIDTKSLVVYDKAVLPEDTTIGSINFANISNFFNSINDTLNKKDLFVDTIQFSSQNPGAGLLNFNDLEGVLQVSLSPNVTMGVGIDNVLKVYNDTLETLTDGEVVYNSGVIESTKLTKVKLSHSSQHVISNNTVGVVTEPIPSGQYGFVTRRGYVSSVLISPSVYNLNDPLYLAPHVDGLPDGRFTNEKPQAPDFVTYIGYVSKLSSDDVTADGQIYVDVTIIPISSDISYNNQVLPIDSRLESKNVQSAIDELQLRKADISMLSSNITLYKTTVDSTILDSSLVGVYYKKFVKSVDDPDFPATEIDVLTPAITGTNQYISGSVSSQGLFVGNPGTISVYAVGRIKKVSGNNNQNAQFFFKMYRRTEDGTEHIVAESATTSAITSNDWQDVYATGLLTNGEFLPTDRIVVKCYANFVDNPGGVFAFQLGGVYPFRVLIPVPVNVIPVSSATGIITDVTNFNRILSSTDTNVQKALDTLDDHNHDDDYPSKEFWDNITMAGRLWGGIITATGVRTVSIAAGAGLSKSMSAGPESVPSSINDGQGSTLSYVTWAQVPSLTLVDNAYNFIYYQATTNSIKSTTDFYSVDFTRDFTLGRAYVNNGTVIVRLCGTNVWNFNRRVQLFGEEVFPIVTKKGSMIIGSSGLTISHNGGILWAELVNRFTVNAFNSAGTDRFTYWYGNNINGYTAIPNVAIIDNNRYYNGTTLTPLTAQRYGVHWVYVVHDSTVHVVYGTGDFTLAQAEASTAPSQIPGLLQSYATLIGRVIVQKGLTTLTETASSFTTTFSSTATSIHNELAGRTDVDAHPISAITNLQTTLNSFALYADLPEIVRLI